MSVLSVSGSVNSYRQCNSKIKSSDDLDLPKTRFNPNNLCTLWDDLSKRRKLSENGLTENKILVSENSFHPSFNSSHLTRDQSYRMVSTVCCF